MARLSGRVAVVTGAAQGIGLTYAKAMAAEGAKVCLCDVETPRAAVEEIRAAGGEAFGRVCDVSDAASVAAMIAATAEAFGSVQVLVNNAAVFARNVVKPMEELSSAEWDLALSVNVRGSFECVKAVLPLMRRQNYGKIINISSSTVFKGLPMMLHYVASKGAIVAMTRAMARELGGDGIRCNCIAPGLTMTAGMRIRNNIGAFNAAIAERCLHSEQVPEDLVGALIFLASADSDFMTGQTLVVDGGSTMH